MSNRYIGGKVMKKTTKRILKSFILAIIITTMLMSTVLGAPVKKSIDVVCNSVNITVNNEKVTTDNLLYKGTTYVPLRAISEMLDKEVGWDQKTNTASINDTKLKKEISRKESSKSINLKGKKTIKVTYNSVNITVNGKKVTTDNILYKGTTYVPLRAISEMLDKEVGWDRQTNTASIDDIENIGILKVHYIDVGQGDSIFIELPNEETMLIDGGSKSNGAIVLNYLNEQKVKKIDYLVSTHPHEDHIGGLVEIINKYSIGEIYMPDVTHTTKAFENLLLAINNKGYKINKAIAGDTILDEEGLNLKILSPEKNYSSNSLNNYSVVIKLKYKDNSFIFTGDAEKESESKMVNIGYDLKADVLKTGHHGSNTSTTDSFLSKVDPKYAIISCGVNNKYGHPDNDIISKLKAKNIKIFRTDLDGTIVAKSNGKKITFNKKGSTIKGDSIGNNPKPNPKPKPKPEVKPKPKPKPKPPVENKVEEVFVTKTGSKYHRGNCTSLRRSKIPISLKNARKRYGPCKICNPPR